MTLVRKSAYTENRNVQCVILRSARRDFRRSFAEPRESERAEGRCTPNRRLLLGREWKETPAGATNER